MLNRCSADCCGKPLSPGDPIIQLTHGPWPKGAITPYRDGNEAHNWHPGCFTEFPLIEQFAPYVCASCNQRIKNRDVVVYACRGSMPDLGFVRAEKRGYTLLYVAHVKCQ